MELKDFFVVEMFDNDKLCKCLGIYKKVIENLELIEVVVVEVNIDNFGFNFVRMVLY